MELTITPRYNSVIFSTSQANDYIALLVTPSFLTGATPAGPSDYGNVSLPNDPEPVIYENGTLPALGQFVQDSSIRASITPNLADRDVFDVVMGLQRNLSTLTRLENADCIQAYGTEFVTDFLNVLLVTNGTHNASSGSIVAAYEYHPAPNGTSDDDILDLSWLCDGRRCNIKDQLELASTWDYTLWDHETARISYCLAQPVRL